MDRPESSSWNKNKTFDYHICGVKLKSVRCVKVLGVIIMSNLKYYQQFTDAVNKPNRTLSFTETIHEKINK